jgi:alkanesulfonate monooxygenase SsuD/methylene tetrahydromethanopterin reductase-like flavin-dependent oxidoreductase (luciferase family)
VAGLRFAVGLLQSRTDSTPSGLIFRQTVEQVQLAEALGFEAAWFTEQHFNDFGTCPDPLTFAAHLAGMTRTIRLGTAVVVLPIHNPITVAERAALVDQLSGGRLDVGIGKAHPKQNYRAFRIDPEENEDRFREGHDVLVKAWTEPAFSYRGRFLDVEDIRLVPRPLQEPHPPLWIATFGNPAMIRFAAERGYRLMHSFARGALAENLGVYRDAYAGSGPMPGVSITRARDRMRKAVAWYLDHSPGRPEKIPNYPIAIEEFFARFAIVGSPRECVDEIRYLRDAHGVDYVACIFGPGGIEHERILACMRLFAERVMPELAG